LQITVILPTFNEVENLPKIVPELFKLPLPDLKLMVIDDNSPDHTGDIAEELAGQYPGRLSVVHRPGKLGLGTAYITGFRLALKDGAQAIGTMDSDFSHPVNKLIPLAAALDTCDIAIGSRYVAGGKVDEAWPIWRKALSSFGNGYARTILRLPIRDVTGGFRLYRRQSIQAMPLERVRSNGYVFMVEIAYLAHTLGLRFQEVPIYFADRRWGKSKMSMRIQLEAALRVWQLLGMYNDIRGTVRIA
jgi:dolichol-phosphate mannosyltransferase